MRRIWSILGASALYHPMLKLAWIQPAHPKGSAIPVALGSFRNQHLSATHTKQTERVLSMGSKHDQLLGTVQITVMRHVYIEVHALLVKSNPQTNRMPVPAQTSASPLLTHTRPHRFTLYPINQADQFHPGRVSYFDNPVYGILVYVKPVPEPSSTIPLAGGG